MANNGDSGLASWVDERLAVLAATPVTGLQTDSARQQEAWVRLRAAQRMMRVRRQAGRALAGGGVVGVVALWRSSDGVMADLKPERDRAAAAVQIRHMAAAVAHSAAEQLRPMQQDFSWEMVR